MKEIILTVIGVLLAAAAALTAIAYAPDTDPTKSPAMQEAAAATADTQQQLQEALDRLQDER